MTDGRERWRCAGYLRIKCRFLVPRIYIDIIYVYHYILFMKIHTGYIKHGAVLLHLSAWRNGVLVLVLLCRFPVLPA